MAFHAGTALLPSGSEAGREQGNKYISCSFSDLMLVLLLKLGLCPQVLNRNSEAECSVKGKGIGFIAWPGGDHRRLMP